MRSRRGRASPIVRKTRRSEHALDELEALGLGSGGEFKPDDDDPR